MGTVAFRYAHGNRSVFEYPFEVSLCETIENGIEICIGTGGKKRDKTGKEL